MVRVCLFGHSFPARADRFKGAHSQSFASLPDDCVMDIKGHSGLTFSRISRNPSRFLSALKGYDIIIVDLGTNDLCDMHITPSSLVSRAMGLMDLFDQFEVKPKCIVFLAVLQRTQITRQGQVTLTTFNHRVKKFNAQLAKGVKPLYPKVQVKSQNKYGQSKYVYDGCHLTNERMRMYINNVLSVVTRITQ